MIPIQYDFFESSDPEFILKKEVQALKEMVDKQRKSMFVRLGNQDKEIVKLINEINRLDSMLMERKK